jgi:5-methylcytosine-specific restriction endonuclease McrA
MAVKNTIQFNLESKKSIEKELQRLNELSKRGYGLYKIAYEIQIKEKEEELLKCIEWLSSKEGIELKIKNLEKSIQLLKDIIQQNHPMETMQDKKENCELLHKYEEELKVLKHEPIKELSQEKEAKVKPKEKKPKKKAISATIKKLVWNTNIGEDIGKAKCTCCKSTDITQMSFNCGHVISEHNGGETIVSNLKPICQNCNSSMGTKDMNDFMLTLM